MNPYPSFELNIGAKFIPVSYERTILHLIDNYGGM